jgi:hypothetical protein
MTVGSRVPKRDCSSVFIPVTNSSVCTTLTLSPCKQRHQSPSERGKKKDPKHHITKRTDAAVVKKRKAAWHRKLTSSPPIMGTNTVGIITAVPSASM